MVDKLKGPECFGRRGASEFVGVGNHGDLEGSHQMMNFGSFAATAGKVLFKINSTFLMVCMDEPYKCLNFFVGNKNKTKF